MNTGCITALAPGGHVPFSRGYSHKARAESDGGRHHRHDKLDQSGGGPDPSRGLTGKLNALANSSGHGEDSGLLKGILEKLTGQKLDDVEVDSLQITQSNGFTRRHASNGPDTTRFFLPDIRAPERSGTGDEPHGPGERGDEKRRGGGFCAECRCQPGYRRLSGIFS